MGFDISMPSCTQICRRSKEIEVDLEVTSSKTPLYIVDDSTGLKVYGEGEWKREKTE